MGVQLLLVTYLEGEPYYYWNCIIFLKCSGVFISCKFSTALSIIRNEMLKLWMSFRLWVSLQYHPIPRLVPLLLSMTNLFLKLNIQLHLSVQAKGCTDLCPWGPHTWRLIYDSGAYFQSTQFWSGNKFWTTCCCICLHCWPICPAQDDWWSNTSSCWRY